MVEKNKNKELIKKRTYELIDENIEWMKQKVDKLLDSNAIDCNDNLGGDYIWPKIIICAIAREIEVQYGPKKMLSNYRRYRKEIKNLGYFI